MKRYALLFLAAMSAVFSFADKLPKKVDKSRSCVASVLTYNNGVLKNSGAAVFVGGGDLLSSYSLFAGADSAVVVDYKGTVRQVKNMVGINNIFDCAKFRVVADKKIKAPAISASPVSVGDKLYIMGYGVDKNGFVEEVSVVKVDSVYSHGYYTLDKPMEERFVSLPLVNAKGELVAVMQQAASDEKTNSYAVSTSLIPSLEVSVAVYGKGCYPGTGIRTVLPTDKEVALSCLYMQSMMGDSVSNSNTISDFIAAFPKAYEGYLAKAEFEALTCGDMEAAGKAWDKAFALSKAPAEVHFGKAKVMNTIVQSGDTLSHPSFSFANVIAEVDKAIAADRQPLYISGKADMLLTNGQFVEAAECYKEVALMSTQDKTDMAEAYAKASQCYSSVSDYDNSIIMLDSAVNCFDEADAKATAPYVLTRALVKATAKQYRPAVLDYNKYEQLLGGVKDAGFYGLRAQSELNSKMFQQALNDFDTAIDLAPLNLSYYIEKALLCYRVKLTDEGIRTLDIALELAPEEPNVHYLLGRLYMLKNEDAKGKECLIKAKELGHPDAESILLKMN